MLAFGLKNAPFYFFHLMNPILRGLEDFAIPYLDDIVVFSHNWEGHMSNLREVLDHLHQSVLTIKEEKCQLGRTEVNHLGHTVGHRFRRPLELKLATVAVYPRPVTKTDIRSFLGLTGYYQHYIRDYSQIANPLTDALRRSEPKR